MNRDLVVIFDHFELRMLQANPLAALPRFSKNHQPLADEDHLLHVMQIEPAQSERLTEGVRFSLLKSRFENLLSAAKSKQARLRDLATKANRCIAFFAGKLGKFAAIFVPSRVMSKEIAYRLKPKSAQLSDPRARNPINFA